MLNGVTKLIMTKADVLNAFEEIEVCTGYNVRGEYTEEFPYDHSDEIIETITKTVKGWNQEVAVDAPLPQALEDYIAYVEAETGCEIAIVSLGPDRKQTMLREKQSA